MEFKDRLRFMRELRGFTQEQLATAAGLNRVTIVELEGGRGSQEPADPRVSTIEKLAATLRCKPGDLLGGAARGATEKQGKR